VQEIRVGLQDGAGFSEGCGRDGLLPPQISGGSEYKEMRYYNRNSTVPRDQYRLALILDDGGSTYRLMIGITELSEVHVHRVGSEFRYTFVFNAYAKRRLSALEYRRSDEGGQEYVETSIFDMYNRHAPLFQDRTVVLRSGSDRLIPFLRSIVRDAHVLIGSLRSTTSNAEWADSFILCLEDTSSTTSAEDEGLPQQLPNENCVVTPDAKLTNVTTFGDQTYRIGLYHMHQ